MTRRIASSKRKCGRASAASRVFDKRSGKKRRPALDTAPAREGRTMS